MKPSMTSGWRRSVERVDHFCGRCNGGLMAVAIVLALITSLAVVYRTVHWLRVPEHFAIASTA